VWVSADVRAALAAACNTVADVNVSAYYRQSSRTGDGIIQLARIEYPPNGFGGVTFWDVIVCLPTDTVTAQQKAEELIPALHTALSRELSITGVSFATLSIDNGAERPALVISGHRESE
jgi:hypothetical protein